jgi:hypothetical protein
MLPWLVAAIAAGASSSILAGEPAAAAAVPSPSPTPARSAEATKARQEADRQRLIAKLRADAPKRSDKQKAEVLDLPIFHRYERP